MDGLLRITPSELRFPVQIRKRRIVSLLLESVSTEPVVFKLKTNNIERYRVKPYWGIIQPGSVAKVEIQIHTGKELPSDLVECKDLFRIQAAPFPEHLQNEVNVDASKVFSASVAQIEATMQVMNIAVALFRPEDEPSLGVAAENVTENAEQSALDGAEPTTGEATQAVEGGEQVAVEEAGEEGTPLVLVENGEEPTEGLEETTEVKESANEMQESANEMQESANEMQESANEMQESANEMQESANEMQESAAGLEESAAEEVVQESTQEVETSARAMEESVQDAGSPADESTGDAQPRDAHQETEATHEVESSGESEQSDSSDDSDEFYDAKLPDTPYPQAAMFS